MSYSKYHAKKTEVEGIVFDSKKEAERYRSLRLLERCGAIKNLKRQIPFLLIEKSVYGRAVKYVADFVYEKDGVEVVEDVKGYKTDVYKLKRRMMAEKYGIVIREV